MTVRMIIMWPEPWLALKSDPVLPEEFNSDEMKELSKDLVDTMRATKGVGLSAIQLGVQKRIIVIPDPENTVPGMPLVLCNPELSELSEEKQSGQEGCLSLPQVLIPKERSVSVKVSGKLVTGDPYQTTMTGLYAVAAQHEYDHLEGKTIADGIGPVKKSLVEAKLNKFLRERDRENKNWKKVSEKAKAARDAQTSPDDYTIPSSIISKT